MDVPSRICARLFQIVATCLFVGANITSQAEGSIVVQSTIESIPGIPSSSGGEASEVDYWHFTVHTDGVVTIDVLSWEWDRDSDGVAHFMDSSMYLFRDDGALDVSDLVAMNDDSQNTFGDGSMFPVDSYLSLALPAGNYVLAISDFFLVLEQAVSGINTEGAYPGADDGTGLQQEATGGTLDLSYADYQLTFTGDLTLLPDAVPEPSSLALLSFGGLAIALARWSCRHSPVA